MLTQTLESNSTPKSQTTTTQSGKTSNSDSDFSLADLLGEGAVNAWALGCENCRYGICNHWNINRKQKMPLYLDKIAAYQAGEANICTCRAGQSLRRWVEKKMETMRLEELELAELHRSVAARRYERLFSSTGAPPHMAEYTFKAYYDRCRSDPGKQAAIAAIREHFDNGKTGGRTGIMLWGRSDVGKTGALVPLFSRYVSQFGAGLWIQYNELIAQLRNWQDGHVEERIRELQQAPLLFIDDLGDPLSREGVKDYVRESLFRIFDQRNQNLITFVTSNLSPAELSALLHERTVKRIGLLCSIVEVGGEQLGVLGGAA